MTPSLKSRTSTCSVRSAALPHSFTKISPNQHQALLQRDLSTGLIPGISKPSLAACISNFPPNEQLCFGCDFCGVFSFMANLCWSAQADPNIQHKVSERIQNPTGARVPPGTKPNWGATLCPSRESGEGHTPWCWPRNFLDFPPSGSSGNTGELQAQSSTMDTLCSDCTTTEGFSALVCGFFLLLTYKNIL